MSNASDFAEKVLNELNDSFETDEQYIEALEELIDRAESMLVAKREEMEKD